MWPTAQTRELSALACDVCFAGDDSLPPDVLVARQIEQTPDLAGVMWNIFDRLRGEYDSGSLVSHPSAVANMIRHAIDLPREQTESLIAFFDHLNRILFQHQTLAWLADADLQLHLYGDGWSEHPQLGRFARGTFSDDAMRLTVYRASRINLAADVYGAVTPSVIEGIEAGGFFLMRFCPQDLVERFYPPLLDFCDQLGIHSNEELAELATQPIRNLLEFASRTIGTDVLSAWPNFIDELRSAARAGYTRAAAAIWPQYPAVSFASKDELIGLVGKYLYDVPQRQRVAGEMRRQLLDRFGQVRVNRRLLRPVEEIAA